MSNDELVSIIVPIYNGEAFISDCVESLIEQTYKNIEIILINDGSTDGTLKKIENFKKKDKRIIVISQKNSGVSESRNNGIKKSKGKYITFVDSDDTVKKNYIEYLVDLIMKNDADIALTRKPLKFNSKTNVELLDIAEDKIEIFDGIRAANEMLLYKIVISSWNKMFDRKLLNKNKIIFNKCLSFGEGFEFVINAFLCANKVVIGNKKIYNYRVDNKNSVMTKFSRKLVTGSIDSQNSIYELINKKIRINKKYELLIKSWKYSFWHTNCDCFNTIIGTNSKKENIDLYKYTKKNCKKFSLHSIQCDITNKEKVKSLMYFVSPVITAKIINKFRIRKYTKKIRSCKDD